MERDGNKARKPSFRSGRGSEDQCVKRKNKSRLLDHFCNAVKRNLIKLFLHEEVVVLGVTTGNAGAESRCLFLLECLFGAVTHGELTTNLQFVWN